VREPLLRCLTPLFQEAVASVREAVRDRVVGNWNVGIGLHKASISLSYEGAEPAGFKVVTTSHSEVAPGIMASNPVPVYEYVLRFDMPAVLTSSDGVRSFHNLHRRTVVRDPPPDSMAEWESAIATFLSQGPQFMSDTLITMFSDLVEAGVTPHEVLEIASETLARSVIDS